jgi:hypothetical protein
MAIPSVAARTIRDLGAGATLFLHASRRSALWARLSVMAHDRLPSRRNLDLTPWGRDLRVLRVGRSPRASLDDVESPRALNFTPRIRS